MKAYFVLILIACAFFKSKATFEGFLTIIDLVFNGGKNLDRISPDISLSRGTTCIIPRSQKPHRRRSERQRIGIPKLWHKQLRRALYFHFAESFAASPKSARRKEAITFV